MGLYNESLNQNIDNLQVNTRLGNGGTSGGYTQTLLADGEYTNGNSINLSSEYTNYDDILFVVKNTSPSGFITNHYVNKETINYVIANDYTIELYGYSSNFISLKFTGNSAINFVNGGGVVYKVYGIKY